MLREQIIQDIVAEREYQEKRGWRDEFNSGGLFAAYISNYASRWAMPVMFDPRKYGFRACMVKVAALAIAAIEWFDAHGASCPDIPKASAVVPTETGKCGEPVYGLFVADEGSLVDRYGEDPGPEPAPEDRIDAALAKLEPRFVDLFTELSLQHGRKHRAYILLTVCAGRRFQQTDNSIREVVQEWMNAHA